MQVKHRLILIIYIVALLSTPISDIREPFCYVLKNVS